MLGVATVNTSNFTDPLALAAIVTGFVSMTRPSISSRTGRAVTAVALRLVRPAVIVTRSSPENAARAMLTDDTLRSDVCASATEMGVTTVPSGKWMSSCRSQPVF